jgi:hypothetical protein
MRLIPFFISVVTLALGACTTYVEDIASADFAPVVPEALAPKTALFLAISRMDFLRQSGKPHRLATFLRFR